MDHSIKGSIVFNAKLGTLQWQGEDCPYVDVKSPLGQVISTLESAKQEIIACLGLLELMLANEQTNYLMQEAFTSLFFSKFDKVMSKSQSNTQSLPKRLLAKSAQHLRVYEDVCRLCDNFSLLANMSMSLRLALKPMTSNEAILSFYCFKQGKPVFSVKGIVKIRKLLRFTLKQLEKELHEQYESLKKEYQSADIHGLYNLAYQGKKGQR